MRRPAGGTSRHDPLFLVALRLESLALRLGAPGADQERIGMGPVRAVAACTRLGRAPEARPVVLIGCAGALDPTLRPGDLVVASAIVEAGRTGVVPLDGADVVAATLAAAPGIAGGPSRVHLAPIASSPRIVHGEEAREQARVGGAVAVDMESLWCAPLARSRPFTVVRAILDVPGKDLFSLGTAAVALRCARSLAAAARALAEGHPHIIDRETLMEIGEH